MARLVASRWTRILAPALALLMLIAGLTVLRRGGAETIEVTAHFTRTIGLYPNSAVRVLGVRVGTVRSITPAGTEVLVRMAVRKDVPIPADAQAFVVPPALVADRYVGLSPAYDGGEYLRDGDEIPVERTVVAVELDDILESVDRLLVALGPRGARNSLAELVDVGARTFGSGGGQDVNDTITGLARTLDALTSGQGDVGAVIGNLATFTNVLARSDTQVRRLIDDLAGASEQLAAQRTALGAALQNLSVALGEVASLVRDHKATLVADVRTLAGVSDVLVKNRTSLTEALDVLPLGLSNLANSVNEERGTVDIRNNSHQLSSPESGYSVLLCQLLFPILNQPCPPYPGAPTAAGRRAEAADRLTLAGLLGGRR